VHQSYSTHELARTSRFDEISTKNHDGYCRHNATLRLKIRCLGRGDHFEGDRMKITHEAAALRYSRRNATLCDNCAAIHSLLPRLEAPAAVSSGNDQPMSDGGAGLWPVIEEVEGKQRVAGVSSAGEQAPEATRRSPFK
jgi:hypothetical protein